MGLSPRTAPPLLGVGVGLGVGGVGVPDLPVLEGYCPQENCFVKDNAISSPPPGSFHPMATKLSALLVVRMDSCGSFTVPIRARMQSTFSGTTSASWWIAWKQ